MSKKMSVAVALNGSALIVNGERVKKDWGFTRKGSTTRMQFYTVERWGRADVTVRWYSRKASSTSFRNDLRNMEIGEAKHSTVVMSKEVFALFVEKFYGMTLAEGQAIDEAQREQEHALMMQERYAAKRNEAHEFVLGALNDLRTMCGAVENEYAALDMIFSAYKRGYDEGYEIGRESGWDDGVAQASSDYQY